jgi:peptidyl-prolyl cis-trans isomerase SurA
LAFALVRPIPAGGAPADAIIARVNGEPVLLSELRESAVDQGYSPQALERGGPWSEAWRRALTQHIDETLLAEYAKRESVTVDQAEIAAQIDALIAALRQATGSERAFQTWLETNRLTMDQLRRLLTRREERRMLASKVVSRLVSVDAAKLDAFRAEREAAGLPVRQANLAQILVRCPAAEQETEAGRNRQLAALVAARQAVKDPKQWDAIAAELSKDPELPVTGGSLGWIDPAKLRKELSDAVIAMKPGDVTMPIASPEGFHVIMMLGWRTTRDLLFASEFAKERETLVKRLRREASIRYYDFQGAPIDLSSDDAGAEAAATAPATPMVPTPDPRPALPGMP